MLRTLTLATVAAAALMAGSAAAQTTMPPQTAPQPPVSQQPPVQTDPADPATQDADQAPSSTSAMPAAGQTAPAGETPGSTGGMQPPSSASTPTTTPMAATSGTPAFATQTQSANVFGALQASGQFTMLIQALQATNLTSVLETQPSITVFAPTDAAFAALPEAQRTALMGTDEASRTALQRLLLHHVVATRVASAQLQGRAGTVPSAANVAVAVNGTATPMTIGGAPIVQADVQASNGVIHVLGGVINPSAPPPPTTMQAPASPDASAAPTDPAAPGAPDAAAAPTEPTTAEPATPPATPQG